MNSTLNSDTNKMADQILLAKARFDDLPNFSGHPSEDVEHFLKSIKNRIIMKFSKSFMVN
jgi:hypothetical protein